MRFASTLMAIIFLACLPGIALPSVALFDMVEYQRPLVKVDNWLGAISRNLENPIFLEGYRYGKNTGWKELRQKTAGKSGLGLLREVNAYWNKWPYKSDPKNWGKNDYWEAPYEFVSKSGDCEDYAIVKYFTLKELGVDKNDMRIVVVQDELRNIAHAILAVWMDGNIYILDNLSSTVLSHKRLKNYIPHYSVNETARWMHIRPKHAGSGARS